MGKFEIDSINANPTIFVYLKRDYPTSGKGVKKLTEKVQIRQNRNDLSLDVRVNPEILQANQSEIELFDLQGTAFYKERLNKNTTIIPLNRINKKGFSTAVIRDVKTGRKIAVEKIILM